MYSRGVTIYPFIAIHIELILYCNASWFFLLLIKLFIFIQFSSFSNCKSRKCMPVTFITSYKQEAQRATYRSPEYNVPHLLPHLGFLIGPKNTNFVEDIEIFLSINFCQIQFIRFRAVLFFIKVKKCPLLTACHYLYVRVISLPMQNLFI